MLEEVIAWTVFVLATLAAVIRFFILPLLPFFLGSPEEYVEDDTSPRVGFHLHYEDEDEEEFMDR